MWEFVTKLAPAVGFIACCGLSFYCGWSKCDQVRKRQLNQLRTELEDLRW